MPSLFELEREQDVDGLVRLLRESDNPTVRKRAAEILGGVDESARGHVEPLAEAVQVDENEAVKAAAIDALTTLDRIDVLLEALGREVDIEGAEWAVAETFVSDLGAEEPTLRMAAANVLGKIGSSNAVGPLLERLDDPNPRVRARVARALGKIGDPTAAGALVEHLDGEPIGVRREVADALGYVGGAEALAGLMTAADDENETIRRTVASSLGQFGDERAIDEVVTMLTDESDLVRRAATFSLIEILSDVSTERSDALRNEIVGKMSARQDPVIVESLVEIVEEGTQAHQRRNATWLLGRVTGDRNEKEAIEALVDAMTDDDQLIAQFAATSLGEIGGPTAESALIRHIDTASEEESVAMAAFTLGSVGGERAKAKLNQLIEETESEEVRRRAFAAVSKLGGSGPMR
ncbi:MAG: HEAT repeat domain-containing protein [Halodesulfurarchaeum sp.]